MVFWVLLALMTGAAVMTVLWPLSRTAPAAARAHDDVGFYRDQLAEIARDESRGLISGQEAEAARIESGRRLLRATEAAPGPGYSVGEPALRRRRAAAALALSVVPLVGLTLYGALGSPHVPGFPLAARTAPDAKTLDIASALARIETHLAQAPDDRRGWELVAPIYLRLGRYDDAARAFGAAIRLGATDEGELNGYGEALVSAAGGVVSADARGAFEKALAQHPDSAKAQFYLALAAEQDGDLNRARQGYAGIIRGAEPGAPYLPLVQTRLAAIGGGAGAEPRPAPLKQVPPEIAAMVDGLDQRLKDGGGTGAEWSRLIRSLTVLGRLDDARDRLARARVALASDPAALADLDMQAKNLGVGAGDKPSGAEEKP
jgi:cytochrome c-type biogenesis protein CcmH